MKPKISDFISNIFGALVQKSSLRFNENIHAEAIQEEKARTADDETYV